MLVATPMMSQTIKVLLVEFIFIRSGKPQMDGKKEYARATENTKHIALLKKFQTVMGLKSLGGLPNNEN